MALVADQVEVEESPWLIVAGLADKEVALEDVAAEIVKSLEVR